MTTVSMLQRSTDRRYYSLFHFLVPIRIGLVPVPPVSEGETAEVCVRIMEGETSGRVFTINYFTSDNQAQGENFSLHFRVHLQSNIEYSSIMVQQGTFMILIGRKIHVLLVTF